MPTIAAVPLAKAYRLLNHGPTVLVTSAAGTRRNVMAAAWVMPLDFEPPKVLAVIDKNAFSRELIEASGTFALNIPSRAQAELTLAVGSTSGRDGDKFAAQAIDTFAATAIDVPLIAGCLGWLECRVIAEPHNQAAYDLFIGEVVAAHAASDVFRNGHWLDAPAARRSLHHIAGGQFFVAGEQIDVSKETP